MARSVGLRSSARALPAGAAAFVLAAALGVLAAASRPASPAGVGLVLVLVLASWTATVVLLLAPGVGVRAGPGAPGRSARSTAERAGPPAACGLRPSDGPAAPPLSAADERASIAADLHDWMGQGLTGVGLWLDRLRVQADPTLASELRAVRVALDGVADGARERVRRLRASVLGERTLAEAIVGLARHIEATGGPEVVVVVPGGARLHPAVEDQLWCVVLEAVANARRHSVPTRLVITWEVDGPRSRLVVQNDGPRAVPADPAGVGLRGMHDRARRIGASLWAGPVDDGWCVRVERGRWAPTAPSAQVEPAG